jgi:hypothetical protein
MSGSLDSATLSAVIPAGKQPLFLCLTALLLTFVFTRAYTRLARTHQWGSAHVAGGVHLHHMAVGIVLVLASGMTAVAFWPVGSSGRALVAIAFGIGAGLTLDEFALWLYLRDVYWTPEGRRSIDATVVALLIGSLLLVGSAPFSVTEARTVSRELAVAVIASNACLAALAVLKGKVAMAIVSMLLPFVGLVSAFRLAKPASPWAKWFYGADGVKAARAGRRFNEDSTLTRAVQRFEDLVGGAPQTSSSVDRAA